MLYFWILEEFFVLISEISLIVFDFLDCPPVQKSALVKKSYHEKMFLKLRSLFFVNPKFVKDRMESLSSFFGHVNPIDF